MDMDSSIYAVERILNYNFKNKQLLEDALTHPSFLNSESYERLEFVGDAAIGLAISNYIFLAYPKLNPGQLSLIRAANVSTEKLARVALKLDLYRFIRRSVAALDDKVREFAAAVNEEDEATPALYGGPVKAPKILADIVEALAAAIYIDVDFDLQKLWVIFRGLLEPIITFEDLQQQPQPVTTLFELCRNQGKHVDVKYWKKGSNYVSSIYIDGELIASGSSEQKETAKFNAAKVCLRKLQQSMPTDDGDLEMLDNRNGDFVGEPAKQKLNELCEKQKWPKPKYSVVKDEGPSNRKIFVCSVKISTDNGVLCMVGDEKPKVKHAKNSAAYLMICALKESNYL